MDNGRRRTREVWRSSQLLLAQQPGIRVESSLGANLAFPGAMILQPEIYHEGMPLVYDATSQVIF